MSPTRRELLETGVGMAAMGSLVGCLGAAGLGDDEQEADGYAAFFAIHDWARAVGGETMQFENPVGTGRMGHGWSPDADITPEVAATDVFFYLDTPEFSWAQDIAANIERDYEDTRTVDLLDGLEPYLISFDHEGSDRMPRPETGLDVPADSVSDFDIWDLRSQEQLGYWHTSREHWHGGLPDVPVGGTAPIGIALQDDQGRVLALGDDTPYRIDARTVGGEGVVDIGIDGSTVEFEGTAVGEADIVFEVYRGDELIYDTAPDLTTIEVVEHIEEDGEFHDPHSWVDPIIAREMVDTISETLATLDPDNADTYSDNAAAYTEDLESVDEAFRRVVSESELDVAVFAGHDSYQYVERRYGFDLQTPVGVSPDAQAARDEIIGLIEAIDENGIDTVLFDPFEAPSPGDSYPQIVESILDESRAEAAAPLTPASGTTDEWTDKGWGYVEQMTEVNIPSLEAALNPG